jgi:hypothetical protein
MHSFAGCSIPFLASISPEANDSASRPDLAGDVNAFPIVATSFAASSVYWMKPVTVESYRRARVPRASHHPNTPVKVTWVGRGILTSAARDIMMSS